MATNPSATFANGLGINLRPLLLLLGVAVAVAIGVTIVLWWRGPDWSLLYGNLSDGDAGNVVQALQTAGIEYKLDNSSGAIMVPAERVHDARLQLAAQGLPAGKSGGFAMIIKDPGFGASQFMENARYQYALETELAQTISSLQAVQAARVQLALPPQSAFVSDHRSASASVLLQLRAGRRLAPEQVSAVVHLVASSVPELEADRVTVVDQEGRLLSAPKSGDAAAAAEQFEAQRRLEDTYASHIEALLSPLVGEGRVRAQVTVDLDQGASEQASEQYKPDSAVVRSEQNSQQVTHGGAGSGGIPGSLTNQPPAGGSIVAANRSANPASAASGAAAASAANARAAAAAGNAGANASSANGNTANANAANGAAGNGAAGNGSAAGNATPADTSQQSTRNYEIDRTVSYTRQPGGRIKRLTVAVLVDNLRSLGTDGKVTQHALTQAQIDNVTKLVKDAVGFDQARGDSINVVNEPFMQQTEVLAPQSVPLLQRPWLMNIMRLVLGALVLVALALGVLRPLIKNLATQVIPPPPPPAALSEGRGPGPQLAYEQQVVQARNLVSQDPKRVAQVVKTWVGEQ